MGALWESLMVGGWFVGELTLFLWFILGAIVLIPLGIISSLTEIPDDDSTNTSGGRIVASIILFGITLFLLNWGGIPLWNLAKEHVAFVGLGALGFVALGVTWSMFKYRKFAVSCKEQIRKLGERFCAKHELDPKVVITDVDGQLNFNFERQYSRDWNAFFTTESRGRLCSSGATADEPGVKFQNNKERITLWFLFWPMSVLRYVVGDMLAELLDTIIMSMKGIYEKIGKRHEIKVVYTEPSPSTTPASNSEDDEVATFRGDRDHRASRRN